MASLHGVLLTIAVFCFVCATSDDLNTGLAGVRSCEDKCEKYAFHSGGKGNSAECCARGCRFFSILSFILDCRDINTTVANCAANCDEAYSRQTHRQACHWGCRSQQHTSVAAKEHIQQELLEEEEVAMTHMLYPLLYMHSVYSNILDKVHSHMEVSWSVFTQADRGELVVVRSQPRIIEFDSSDDLGDGVSWLDDKTSPYLETNIVGQDNSATPLLNFRASQMRAAHSADPSGEGLRLDAEDRAGRLDWWTCVVKKTDIARTVLCFLILATAVVMIWVCLSAATTSIPEQQLSINGDLEYLRAMSEKDSFKLLHPQDRVEARPLPVKICVERI